MDVLANLFPGSAISDLGISKRTLKKIEDLIPTVCPWTIEGTKPHDRVVEIEQRGVKAFPFLSPFNREIGSEKEADKGKGKTKGEERKEDALGHVSTDLIQML